MNKNYVLPLDCNVVLYKKKHPACSLEDSIKHFIHLILYTSFGEYRYDRSFGCEMWHKNFDNIHSVSIWKDDLRNSILNSIQKYETRLSDVNITINLKEQQINNIENQISSRYRQRIIIKIEGIIIETNQEFLHWEYIFFSPLSMV